MSQIIKAAGGLVLNPQKQILWIFRKGKWDLPKGKMEPNETITSCAIREVMEETGLIDVHIQQLLTKTEHTYHDPYLAMEVVKETYWFEMNTTIAQEGIPQIEEDIESILWVNQETMDIQLANTYDNILSVINAFIFSRK